MSSRKRGTALTLRRMVGMIRVVAHLAKGAVAMALALPRVSAARKRQIVQRWSLRVLGIFGIELRVGGPLPRPTDGRPLMLVGNHVSWIDIYAYLAVTEVRFVAKADVRAWPLIGWFAGQLGSIFVDRERPRDAVRAAAEVQAALVAGDAVCLFPEGTTTDGQSVLPFQPTLFAAAVTARASVQPVSIAYRTADGAPCRRMAFVGDATLLASIWSLVAGERSIVELTFHPEIAPGVDRRALAQRAEHAVRRGLGLADEIAVLASSLDPAGREPIAA